MCNSELDPREDTESCATRRINSSASSVTANSIRGRILKALLQVTEVKEEEVVRGHAV